MLTVDVDQEVSEAEAYESYADEEQEKPTLHPHTRVEPFESGAVFYMETHNQSL
jgi:hypothetical protein